MLKLPAMISRRQSSEVSRSCAPHRAWVRKHHCSVPECLALPIECAHVRRGTDGGMSLKSSDRWTISLCAMHHREQHSLGEHSFEIKYSLDLMEIAEEFARRSPHRMKLRVANMAEDLGERLRGDARKLEKGADPSVDLRFPTKPATPEPE